jgi:dipeptidyl-peptidase III
VTHIYSVEPEASLLIGDPNKGHVSNYYFGEITTEKEVAAIQKAAESSKVDILNTRVEKLSDGNFILHVASIEELPEVNLEMQVEGSASPVPLKIKYTDFKEPLQRCVESLIKAKPHAANPNQRSALEQYIRS